ncbi:MAG: hypothetical protein AB7Q29_12305 [Vicinamibacterales bacterium]
MVKLLMFTACEKVVISQDDNSSSLLSILQGFDIPIAPPEGESLLLPVSWTTFVLWEGVREDPDRYKQRVRLIAPDGTVLETVEAKVISSTSPDIRFHRSMIRRAGLQIRGVGDHTLVLSLKDGEGPFADLASFAIPITVKAPEPPVA